MKTTAQKLGMTDTEYDSMIFSIYSQWCGRVATNSRHFQAILANTSISLWFLTELVKCETEFHELTDRYSASISITKKDYKQCFNNCIDKMADIKPQALLESFNRLGQPRSRSIGIQVFNHLNSN